MVITTNGEMPLLGRSGLIVILFLAVALTYSGAGSWLWERIKRLDSGCYQMLQDVGAGQMGAPLCRGVAEGIAALERFGNTVGDTFRGWQEQIFSDSNESLNNAGQTLRSNIATLASSSETLNQMMQNGPHLSVGTSIQEQFQRGIDSFTIGQSYLSGGTATQAVPWLQQGAAQPQGYGVLSQMTLGNLYHTGGHGIAPNNAKAQIYLEQARHSLDELTGSNTPQAQQVLQTLPAAPQELKQQIDAALQQIKAGK